MIKRIAFITCILLLNSLSFGQVTESSQLQTLEKLFGRLRTGVDCSEKNSTNDSIIRILSSYASSDSVFNNRLSNLRYLGQITSPDSLVKLLTWNLVCTEDENSYFCLVIKRNVKKGRGAVTFIRSGYKQESPSADSISSASSWYGTLYYDIRPFEFNGTIKYILLGIDYGNPFITRKVIDVADFGPGGEITFGLKCFTDGKSARKRIVFEYSPRAVMSLKFVADTSIVFDHLSPSQPQYANNHQFYGPDFSFDSFNFQNGWWRYKGDIDIRNK